MITPAEIIYLFDAGGDETVWCETDESYAGESVKYIRMDKYEELQKENEKLKQQNKELTQGMN